MSSFLKCDSSGCDHLENVPAITADMVGKPCPKCGASLLTPEDWAHYETVFRPMIEAATALGLVESATPGELRAVRINYHDGELRIRQSPPLPSQQG